ncbi:MULTISPECIES: hypothetical protein [Lacrimispora]|uniref:hypothetical protein n=1 Tax=Lacrimispora indolis TaxID=69825 RepID=UPI00045E793B|nr:hypothetical protein [Lacrimispora indolis]
MKFIHRLKRIVARVLAFAMLLNTLSISGITAYADTELNPDTSMKNNGGGLNSAYYWGRNDPNGQVSYDRWYGFNIQGILDPERIGAEHPYINLDPGKYQNNNTGGIQLQPHDAVPVTWDYSGFKTVIRSGSENDTIAYPITIENNGGVQKITDRGYNVEVQMKVYPSADRKWTMVEYVMYNNENIPKTMYMATGADIMVGDGIGYSGGPSDPADASTLYLDDQGFHMVNEATKQTFDVVTNGDSEVGRELGVTTVDSRWAGSDYMVFSNSITNNSSSYHNARYYANLSDEPTNANHKTDGTVHWIENMDTKMSYSWKLDLGPYQKVVRKVAFKAQEQTYYVSSVHGDDVTGTGEYDKPFNTIERAKQAIGTKKGYIYIQDYAPVNQTIVIGESGGSPDITIKTADVDHQRNRITTPVALKKDCDGPLIEMDQSGTGSILRLDGINLSGENVSDKNDPLILADRGTIQLNKDAVLEKNIVTSSDPDSAVGSAVHITNSANLILDGAEVRMNQSALRGAIYFNSTGKFQVLNEVTIKDNVNAEGKKANVYLADGKYITVDGDLGSSRIGITSEQIPEASVGETTISGQEVVIAVPSADYSGSFSSCPFADNFFADADSGNGVGIYATVGSSALNNSRNTVLKRNGYAVSFAYRDSSTGGTVTSAPDIPSLSFASGDEVVIPPPSGISGYELTGISIDQGTGSTLTAVETAGDTFGKITGTMPGQDVVVTYEYTRLEASIAFVVNGGTPQPETLTGTAGNSVNALLPSVTRYGYVFKGWSKVNNQASPEYISSLPAVYQADPVTYYAIWESDPNVKFDYTVDYTNQNGSIVFQTTTAESAYSVEAEIQSQKKSIHGYLWSLLDSLTSPVEYNYDGLGAAPIGNFDGSTGQFTGRMPGQDAAVKYAYKVDRNNPSARSDLTVRYVTENGTVIHDPAATAYYPEDAINTAPLDLYGYQFVSGSITAGDTPDDADGNLVSAVQGSFGNNGSFTGVMPNQPVEITYIYEATGEGYRFTVSYLDNNTLDNNLRNIINPEIQQKTADTAVSAEFRELYGYTYESAAAVPLSGGSFDGTHDFTGIMPNDDLTVSYRYDRVPSQWTRIIFKSGINGAISHGSGVSSDVQEQGNGTGVYEASVLKNDGTTAGQTDSYTWSTIKEKRLVPLAQADQYYRFAGWFIDQNGNGSLDAGEQLLEEDHRFTGDETVTALFEEDPEKWINIQFAAGEHGSLADGSISSLHIQYDRTWGDIAGQIPGYVPEVNYLVDGWYDGDTEVESTDGLKNGHTYTIRFYPDPAVFGTDVAAPDASGGLNGEGKGKITVYHTTAGYQYVITDLSGKIVGVQTGTIAGRVYFDGLYPGARYLVYEAAGTVNAVVGNQIGETAGNISDPVEVLTPVVETNYQILYDENHEGKTVLVIKPADKKSDYAVLSKEGTVILTQETGSDGWQTVTGNPGSVTFSGLNYNEEYIVVARPKGETGITAESRLPDGSAITTDPGGALEIPNYIVETLEGRVVSVDQEEIDAARYEEAHKGDKVKITADASKGAGETFLYWKITIGSVPGLTGKLYERELAFDMPDTNLVFTAYYSRPVASPSNATVVDEVRGGSGNDIALDPGEIPDLEEELTTDADRILMDQNHADVTYKVVYTKNAAKATESNAVKASPEYNSDHSQAFKAAWGLNVDIERYVNGRKTAMATPSDAEFTTFIQLGKDDVDMMDYQLYRIFTDPDDGSVQTELVEMSDDPEETGGLFTFTAQAGMRYVMVYSKAYRLYFLNQIAIPKYQYYFKVRKGEAPSDGYYSFEYGQVEEPEDLFISEEGVEYNYVGWSYREDRLNEFDPDREISRKTYVYAYYQDNQKEVDHARKELEDAIKAAIDKSDDYFLTLKETGKLKEAIEEALEVLERTSPKATLDELLEALEKLQEVTKPLDEALEDRYDHYDKIQGSGSKGGSKGGGGSGSGIKASPYNPSRSRSYTVGTNGNWEELSGTGRQWAFVLNGGIRLTGMWAKLDYASGDVSKNGWYHFNANGIMDYGWFRDEKLDWYYCNTEADGWFGKMKTGWHYDKEDSRWYYLDPETGMMAKGWRNINGKWYYFTEQNSMETYHYDPATEKWIYKNNEGRPLGSMYISEMTPDGYSVGGDGAWLQ